jgi:ribonuclease HI
VFYTDGSKTADGAGAGVCGPGLEKSASLGIYTTAFQAEIYAIIMCVQELLERNYNGRRIFIVTDSQAALGALRTCEVSSGLVLDCLRRANELGANNDLKLVWVPAHAGVAGNQEADLLAKTGRKKPYTGPEPACGIPTEVAKQEIKTLLKQWHCTYWTGTSGQRQSKFFLEGPSKTTTENLLNTSKDNVRKLTGIITGHCRLNKHLYTMGIAEEPTCRGCGEEEETPLHLLCECEAYIGSRRNILGTEKLNQEEVKNTERKKILEFFEETGLL